MHTNPSRHSVVERQRGPGPPLCDGPQAPTSIHTNDSLTHTLPMTSAGHASRVPSRYPGHPAAPPSRGDDTPRRKRGPEAPATSRVSLDCRRHPPERLTHLTCGGGAIDRKRRAAVLCLPVWTRVEQLAELEEAGDLAGAPQPGFGRRSSSIRPQKGRVRPRRGRFPSTRRSVPGKPDSSPEKRFHRLQASESQRQRLGQSELHRAAQGRLAVQRSRPLEGFFPPRNRSPLRCP